MGKFLRSVWSNVTGVLLVAVGALPVADVIELTKSGEILGVIAAAVGGILIGGGRGAESNDTTASMRR